MSKTSKTGDDNQVQHDLETGSKTDDQIRKGLDGSDGKNNEKIGPAGQPKMEKKVEGIVRGIKGSLGQWGKIGEFVARTIEEGSISPEEIKSREADWEKYFGKNFEYQKELANNPEFKAVFMNMSADDYERLIKEFRDYFENGNRGSVQLMFDNSKHFIHILDQKYYDARLNDLKEYATGGRKIEYQKKLAKVMRDFPELFDRSLSGLPEGEKKEIIAANLRLYFFTDDEVDRITNFICDFRNFESDKWQAKANLKKRPEENTEEGSLVELKNKFGRSIFVGDNYVSLYHLEKINSPRIEKQLDDLNMVPESLAKYLVRERLVLFVSNTIINDMVEGTDLEKYLISPQTGGLFDPENRKIYIASSRELEESPNPTSSVILHEYGHAVDNIVKPISQEEKIAAYKKFYPKLSYYVQQYWIHPDKGAEEMMADSFADYLKYSKEEFVLKYDEDWYNKFDKIVNANYDEYGK